MGFKFRSRITTKTTATIVIMKTKTIKSTKPADCNFEQNLIDHGFYPEEYEYPDGRVPSMPKNQNEINWRLRQSRPFLLSSNFSNRKFKEFKRVNAHIFKEKQITIYVIPFIKGETKDRKYIIRRIPFINLDLLTNGTLVPGNLNLFYDARPEQLDR